MYYLEYIIKEKLCGQRLKLKDMSVILYGMKHGILYLRWKNVIIVMVKIRKFII